MTDHDLPTAGQCSHEVVPTSFTAAFGEHTATAPTPDGATAEVLRLAVLTQLGPAAPRHPSAATC